MPSPEFSFFLTPSSTLPEVGFPIIDGRQGFPITDGLGGSDLSDAKDMISGLHRGEDAAFPGSQSSFEEGGAFLTSFDEELGELGLRNWIFKKSYQWFLFDSQQAERKETRLPESS
jgi:hypothetical protein